VFGGIDDVTRSLGHATWWSARVKQSSAPASHAKPTATARTARPDSERAVLEFLHARGVPVIPSILAASRDVAVAFALERDAPLALKIASRDIAHKTEVGGVVLGVTGRAAVGDAFDRILASVKERRPDARIDGVLVSPMRQGGLEFLVGTIRDPQWGPVLAVGLGGIWVEVLADTQQRLLPVTPAEVRSMLTSLRASKLLQGYRGSAPVDLDRLSRVIADIGDAALALGSDLVSLEINPLRVEGSRIEALDGLAIWSTA
jgi:acyl-CoA synthetase (NDP forming)